MDPYSRHIFVCQGNDCFRKGSEEIREEFRRVLIEKKLYSSVKVNKSGCFDQCEYGINVVIYPEGTWYCNVDQRAVKQIIEKHIVAGEVVSNILHYQLTGSDEVRMENES